MFRAPLLNEFRPLSSSVWWPFAPNGLLQHLRADMAYRDRLETDTNSIATGFGSAISCAAMLLVAEPFVAVTVGGVEVRSNAAVIVRVGPEVKITALSFFADEQGVIGAGSVLPDFEAAAGIADDLKHKLDIDVNHSCAWA